MLHPNWKLVALVLVAVPLGCNVDPATLGGTNAAGGRATTGAGGQSATGAGGRGGCSGPGGSCGQSNIAITPLPADILIVQSKALSMVDGWDDQPCQGGCGASSKWSQASRAITTVVAETETTMNWGLVFYGASTCGTTTTPQVSVGPMSSQAVINAFAANQPATGNPIETAVNDAATYLLTLTYPNPKYLLLLTDGLPNCGPGDTSTTADDSLGAEAAVANAKMLGISTFVVGLATASDATATATLDQMALNGGQALASETSAYYSVTDTDSLVAALTAVVGAAASCTFALPQVPVGLTDVAVSAKDATGRIVVIPRDTDGWSYADGSHDVITLDGAACANLRSGAYSNFQVSYACVDPSICLE